ncbi:type II toxin-antitoxin system HicB family antitoxin [Patescibacteria group bacterium]|nr:type II toxin-antitoxin system HicB family antitoxin [Patescibacteria group bacterium]
MQSFVYPVTLTPDKKDGGFVVRFIDFPEAITQGEDVENALFEASDCLEEAVANRIMIKLPIPNPSVLKKGQYTVALSAQMVAKAALYLAMQESDLTPVELARQLNCDEKEVSRLINPRRSSELSRIEAALSMVGKHLIVGVQTAA